MMAVSVSPERRAFGKETLPMLSTYYQSPSGPVSNSLPLKLFQLNDSNAIFIDHNCDGSHARTSHSRTGNFASRSFMRCDAQSI